MNQIANFEAKLRKEILMKLKQNGSFDQKLLLSTQILQRLYYFIFTLVVASTVDRESVSTYILTVLAEDSGLAPLSDRTDVEITVIGE